MTSKRLLTAAACLLVFMPTLAQGQAKAKDEKKKPATEVVAPAPARPSLAESLSGAAKENYDTAVALYKQGAYAQSATKFQAAYDTSKDARLLWNQAAAEKQQRHYAKARMLVRQYVALSTDLPEKDKTDANALLSVLDRLVSEVTVVVNEPGAVVSVDGTNVGESPLPKPISMDTGTRAIRVTKDNFVPYQAQVPIAVGPASTIQINLVPHVKDGRLAIRTSLADSVIAIDSKRVGTGTYSGVVGSGSHTLAVTREGYKQYDLAFTMAEGGTRTLDVTLEKNKRRVPVWAIVAGSVLVAGIATAVIVIAVTPDSQSSSVPDGTFPPNKVILTDF